MIWWEWTRQDADGSTLYRRLGAFAVAGLLALLPTAVYVVVTGTGLLAATQGNAWQVDALVAGGFLTTAAVLWVVWRWRDWGDAVPGMMVALAAATVPYIALSPFWNFSGHVTMSLMPTLYLTLVDRRFAPLLLVPVVMVPNRVYVGAHSLAQSAVAFVVIAAVVVAVYRFRRDRTDGRPGSPATARP
jgi:membrane-associated phospholipid phosphatase